MRDSLVDRGVPYEEISGKQRARCVLHRHVHLRVLIVTVALVKVRFGVVCVQLEEGEGFALTELFVCLLLISY